MRSELLPGCPILNRRLMWLFAWFCRTLNFVDSSDKITAPSGDFRRFGNERITSECRFRKSRVPSSTPEAAFHFAMSANSHIEWTDATWNPIRGCTKISPGCTHCYAETFAERFRGVPGHPYEQGFDLR